MIFYFIAAVTVLICLFLLFREGNNPSSLKHSNFSDAIQTIEKQELEEDLEQGHAEPLVEYRAVGTDIPKQRETEYLTSWNKSGLLIVTVFAFALAAVIYWQVGALDSVTKWHALTEQNTSDKTLDSEKLSKLKVGEVALLLRTRLQKDPEDLNGWMLLARTYMQVGQGRLAEEAMLKALSIAPDNPDVLVSYAQFIGSSNDASDQQRAIEILDSVLKQYPQHQSALLIRGFMYFHNGDYKNAISKWETLKQLRDPQSEGAIVLQRTIDKARELMSSTTNNQLSSGKIASSSKNIENSDSSIKQQAVENSATVTAEISISESVANLELSPSTTVFISARNQSGPRIPLAALKTTLAKLPGVFTLDESMAMMSEMSLASASKIVVEARISFSGTAVPKSGDWYGSLNLDLSTDKNPKISLTIDQQYP